MKVQIQKWGNSLALRIPKAFAVESNVTGGSTVEVSIDNGNIIVKPIREPEYTLEELKSFAAGERKNAQMQTIAGRMRDKDMQAVAEYIAGMRTR